MDFVLPLLLLSTVLYVLVALLFFVGLFHLINQPTTSEKPFISIVIAARNEADYIGSCLTSLKAQTYPTDRFEILVVDDESTDNTPEIISAFQIPNLSLLSVENHFPDMAAKKRPMSVGIKQARGKWILTTDADCTVSPDWVASMSSYMTSDTGVVIGFSQLKAATEKLSFFERLQAFDFLTLMSAAAGAVGLGMPLAASGQNFGYRKALFEKVGGFSTIAHHPSGDDVLLLQLLRKAWSGKIAFAHHADAFAQTWRSETPASFWQQRKRWASNAAYQIHLNIGFFFYIAVVFLVNALIPATLCLAASPTDFKLPIMCWVIKTLADLLVTGKSAMLFKRTDLIAILPLWEILQIPYTVLIGLAGTLSGFRWKDRHHA